MNLFAVEDKKTYQKNTNRFKKSVLDVAIGEINKYTELEVWYTTKLELVIKLLGLLGSKCLQLLKIS